MRESRTPDDQLQYYICVMDYIDRQVRRSSGDVKAEPLRRFFATLFQVRERWSQVVGQTRSAAPFLVTTNNWLERWHGIFKNAFVVVMMKRLDDLLRKLFSFAFSSSRLSYVDSQTGEVVRGQSVSRTTDEDEFASNGITEIMQARALVGAVLLERVRGLDVSNDALGGVTVTANVTRGARPVVPGVREVPEDVRPAAVCFSLTPAQGVSVLECKECSGPMDSLPCVHFFAAALASGVEVPGLADGTVRRTDAPINEKPPPARAHVALPAGGEGDLSLARIAAAWRAAALEPDSSAGLPEAARAAATGVLSNAASARDLRRATAEEASRLELANHLALDLLAKGGIDALERHLNAQEATGDAGGKGTDECDDGMSGDTRRSSSPSLDDGVCFLQEGVPCDLVPMHDSLSAALRAVDDIVENCPPRLKYAAQVIISTASRQLNGAVNSLTDRGKRAAGHHSSDFHCNDLVGVERLASKRARTAEREAQLNYNWCGPDGGVPSSVQAALSWSAPSAAASATAAAAAVADGLATDAGALRGAPLAGAKPPAAQGRRRVWDTTSGAARAASAYLPADPAAASYQVLGDRHDEDLSQHLTQHGFGMTPR